MILSEMHIRNIRIAMLHTIWGKTFKRRIKLLWFGKVFTVSDTCAQAYTSVIKLLSMQGHAN